MKKSYLIQRLQAPVGFDNPFSFGGGLKNGGLSEESMSMLRGIFSFDYMGSAEFEFGAVPKALNRIAREVNYFIAKSISTDKGEIYIFCHEDEWPDISDRIWLYINNSWSRETKTKEMVLLKEALEQTSKVRTLGWLEISNGYFFSIDKDMFIKFCNVFGVDPNIEEE